MRQITFLFTILSFLLLPLVGIQAEEADVYADSIIDQTYNILTPTNALGAPDGYTADYMTNDTYLKFDLGEGEEGIGDLTLYLSMLNFGARVKVEFYNTAGDLLDTWWNPLEIGDTERVAEYEGTDPYRYVRISSTEEEAWKLDAIEVMELYAEEEIVEEIEEIEEPDPETENTSAGRLVKLVDDGNPETTYDSAVYTIGVDGKRHAFPSESVFYSWLENFDSLEEIEMTEMDLYPLGTNVTMRAGTKLVKIQSSPHVYAVEPGGVLRKITTEEIAVDLYGPEWSDRVVDIADGFWSNYSKGEDVTSSVHPSGSFLASPNGEFVYLNNGNYYSISSGTWTSMRFINDNFIMIGDDLFSLYVDGGDLEISNEISFPY